MTVGRNAIITSVSDGLGYEANDKKYIGPFINKQCRVVKKLENGMYLTDLFNPEFQNVNNDYVRYGFLIVSSGNITLIG